MLYRVANVFKILCKVLCVSSTVKHFYLPLVVYMESYWEAQRMLYLFASVSASPPGSSAVAQSASRCNQGSSGYDGLSNPLSAVYRAVKSFLSLGQDAPGQLLRGVRMHPC